MSDVYNAEVDELLIDLSERRAMITAQRASERNPDDAARSLKLSDASGIPPEIIEGDLKRYDGQVKEKLTADIIRRNQHLQDYINGKPLNAILSNDDWAALDELSNNLDTFGPSWWEYPKEAVKGFLGAVGSTASASVKGLSTNQLVTAAQRLEGLDRIGSPLPEDADAFERAAFRQRRSVRHPTPEVVESWRQYLTERSKQKITDHPLYQLGEAIDEANKIFGASKGFEESWTRDIAGGFGSVATNIGVALLNPVAAAAMMITAGQGEAVERAVAAGATEEQIRLASTLGTVAGATDLFDILLARLGTSGKALGFVKRVGYAAVAGAFIQGGQEGIQEFIQNTIAQQIYKPDQDLLENVPRNIAIGAIVGGAVGGGIAATRGRQNVKEIEDVVSKEFSKVEPYIAAGEEPPVGLHPVIDGLKAEQAKADIEILGKLLKEAQATATWERSPEETEQFIAQKMKGEIGIPAEAARKFYDDLGFIPQLDAQLQLAEMGSGDVLVDRATWIAKAPPEVMKALEDDIRTRDGGVTLNEAKVAETEINAKKEQEQAPIEFKPSPTIDETMAQGPGIENVDIFKGKNKIGSIDYELRDNGKSMFVHWIEGSMFQYGPELLKAIQEKLPKIEKISGARTTGKTSAATYNFERGLQMFRSGKFVDEGPAISTFELGSPAVDAVRSSASLDSLFTKGKQLEMRDVTRMEDREAFEKMAKIGISKERYLLHKRAIDEQFKADVAAQEKAATAEAKRRVSPEWKANRAKIVEEIKAGWDKRPVIAVDNFFRNKILMGQKLSEQPKINPEFLTDAQQRALPKSILSVEKGMNPDDAASLFKYSSKEEMIQDYNALILARQKTGLRPGRLQEQMIQAEADQRMEQEYGKKADQILDEAREHVLSPTQLDVISQDTLLLAKKAKLQLPLSGPLLRQQLEIEFQNAPLNKIDSKAYMADSGRLGRLALDAEMKGDSAEAFKLAQQREYAAIKASLADKAERKLEQLDKTAKSFNKPVRTSVAQEYTNFIHALLKKGGYRIKLTEEEIAASIQHEGYTSLDDFLWEKSTYPYDFEVPPGYDPKLLEKMTVGEFYEYKAAIDSLHKIGKQEMKIIRAGEAVDRAEARKELIAQLASRGIIRDAAITEKGGHWLYRLDAPFTRTEEMLKAFDNREEMGPFWSMLMPQFSAAKADEFSMFDKVSADFKALGSGRIFRNKWQRSISDIIPSDLVWDSWNNTQFKLTRWNMIKMMLNWGNDSNAGKLVYGITRSRQIANMTKEEAAQTPRPTKDQLVETEAKITTLFETHATQRDWDFVQQTWNIFKGWKPAADTMARSVNGQAPKWIPGRTISISVNGQPQTFDGDYYPLIPDKLRPLDHAIKERQPRKGDGPLGPDYHRVGTNQNHFIERTKANYFVDITSGPEQMIGRMQQEIHDIAFREFIVNASKIIYDPEIQLAIKKYYGVEYQEQLIPWLERIVNPWNTQERTLQGYNDIAHRFNMNLLVSALPLNYTVMLTPSLGTLNLKQLALFNINRTANKKMVMDQSKEIPHMLYNLDRDITQAIAVTMGRQGWTSFQLRATEIMFKPLVWAEQQLRMSTFFGEYMHQKEKGRTDAEAAALADSLVRERHGIAHPGDLPALTASKNPFLKVVTLFMGYFTVIRNWQRQIPDQARQHDYSGMAKAIWGTVILSALLNAAVFTKRKEDEDFWSFAARSVASVPLGMVPWGREIWNYYSEGYRPSNPIVNAGIHIGEVLKDGVKLAQGERPRNVIKHVFNAAGTVVGVPAAIPIGRTSQFLWDLETGEQRPRDLIEFMRGAATGESLLRKR